jgi:peptidoglycan/LPS O-acetylase OafA/YrhL
MALILSQKYGTVPGGLRAFAMNRFLRLYPLYAVVLLLTIGWYLLRQVVLGDRAPAAGIFEMHQYLTGWQMLGVWLSNFSLIGLDFICSWHWSPDIGFIFLHASDCETHSEDVFLGSAIWVIQAWSISMEILFYLCAPLLARLKAGALAAVILASLALDIWISSSLGRTTYFFAPAQLYLFATGMMLYRAYFSFNFSERVAQNRTMMIGLVSVSFLVAWCLPVLWHQPPQWMLILAFAALIPGLFAVSKDSGWDRSLGNLSYPIYLSHMLVGGVVAVILKRLAITGSFATLIMVSSCIIVAAILHRMVETPMEMMRNAISKRLLRLP